jgi:hypothetical protein
MYFHGDVDADIANRTSTINISTGLVGQTETQQSLYRRNQWNSGLIQVPLIQPISHNIRDPL